MLTDRHIMIAQNLLKKQFPNINGFMATTLGPIGQFNVMHHKPFIQILHTGQVHWICTTNIGCVHATVKVYDRLYSIYCNVFWMDNWPNFLQQGAPFKGIPTRYKLVSFALFVVHICQTSSWLNATCATNGFTNYVKIFVMKYLKMSKRIGFECLVSWILICPMDRYSIFFETQK